MKNKPANFKRSKVFLGRVFIALILLGLMGHFYSMQASEGETKGKYTIGPGDKIEISVWGYPELKKEMYVRPDGWISYPLIGEICANGVNPAVLAAQIRQKLVNYINDPEVSVIVVEYKSKKILVLGAVLKPGLYQYEGGMSAFDAVGVAGGYNKNAELRSILVVRNAYSKRPGFYVANLYKAMHSGNVRENVALQPEDIIYVPQSFIGDIGDFMDFFMARIRPAADTYFFSQMANK